MVNASHSESTDMRYVGVLALSSAWLPSAAAARDIAGASSQSAARAAGSAGVGPHSAPTEWLTWLAEHPSGPKLHKYHHYLEIYERHFARFRGQRVRLLEIGIDHGGSLALWRWYFGSSAMLFGADINNRTKVYEGNPRYGSPSRIIIGDQSAPDKFWQSVRNTLAEGDGAAGGGSQFFDIVIDDGSHKPAHMMRTIEEGMKVLAPGGVILIEDIARQDNEPFLQSVHQKFLLGSEGLHDKQSYSSANALQRQVFSITQYPHVLVLESMAKPRAKVKSVFAGDIGMPQPPIGFNRWGYVCGAKERGGRDCNNDGTRTFGGTTG